MRGEQGGRRHGRPPEWRGARGEDEVRGAVRVEPLSLPPRITPWCRGCLCPQGVASRRRDVSAPSQMEQSAEAGRGRSQLVEAVA